MLWSEFISVASDTVKLVDKEFEWMRMYAYLYYMKFYSDPAGAEDFSQDSLERFILKLRDRESLNRSFYMQLVRYTFLDHIRKSKRNALSLRDWENKSDKDEQAEDPIEQIIERNRQMDPEAVFVSNEILDQISAALNGFKDHQKQAIQLRLLGVPAKEITEQLIHEGVSLSENHINVLFHKFKSRMREVCINLNISLC